MDLSPDRAVSRAEMTHAARLARYDTASTALALLSDNRLREAIEQAAVVHTGIGGAAVVLDIGGTPVFVKRVPLTDLERRPENVMSTANLFQLPTFYHYGVGSTGCGVWRELAAHAMTTNWVLSGRCESFPLMYHWRVLEGAPPRAAAVDERARLERAVAYAHFGNTLTDGRRLYFTDFGLATSPRFELSGAEPAFVERNRSHDRCHTVTELVNWLVTTLTGSGDWADRIEFIRRCAEGGTPGSVPPWAAAIIERYAPVAVVMNKFYWSLVHESRATTYPAGAVQRACAG